MSVGADVAVTASTHNGTAWKPLSQLLSPNASLLLISSAIKFRASVPDCNRALATLEYLSAAPISPSVHEIARITIIVNDMGNYGCYNDCSTAEPVPLLAVSTIVIANYGWFSHKWLLLRPGVLLGVVVGVGMLLTVVASVCAWLYFVNRLLSARGKVQKVISSFGIADGVLLEVDGQQADNATETSDGGYTQNEVQANQHLENVATIDTYREDGVAEDDGAADLHVDNDSQDESAVGGASDSISGDGMHDCAHVDVVSSRNEASDVITRDDYAQVDYPVGADWQCLYFSGDEDLPSEAIQTLDLASYAQSTDLLGNSSPAIDTLPANHDPDGEFFSTDTRSQYQSNNADNCLFSGNPIIEGDTFFGDHYTEEGAFEGIGGDDSDGFTLPCCLEALDQQILPTSSIYEPENACTTNQKDKYMPCELDDPVDKEEMQHLHHSMASRVGSNEESQESRRSLLVSRGNVLPASLSSSFVDNCLNQQNVEDDHACEGPCLQSYENTSDCQSSAVEVEAADRSQNEYTNQLNNEMEVSNDLLRSIPCGESYSSSQSSTSTGGNTNVERTLPIEARIGTHGTFEEDRITADEVNPGSDSYPAELFDEEMSQMPELKLVLELPEASSLDEAMDPLDHINLVLSSLETDADGSLLAVLSQSIELSRLHQKCNHPSKIKEDAANELRKADECVALDRTTLENGTNK